MTNKLRVRLHEINQELDKTDTWENPPYRNARRKLNREKARIIKRLEGKDPNWFVEGAGDDKALLKETKSAVVSIMDELKI